MDFSKEIGQLLAETAFQLATLDEAGVTAQQLTEIRSLNALSGTDYNNALMQNNPMLLARFRRLRDKKARLMMQREDEVSKSTTNKKKLTKKHQVFTTT